MKSLLRTPLSPAESVHYDDVALGVPAPLMKRGMSKTFGEVQRDLKAHVEGVEPTPCAANVVQRSGPRA